MRIQNANLDKENHWNIWNQKDKDKKNRIIKLKSKKRKKVFVKNWKNIINKKVKFDINMNKT